MRSKRGFTLIELLIVIAVIGVLASIILVSLSSSKKKANDAAIMASAEAIMKAAQIESSGTQNYSAYFMSTYPAWLTTEDNCNNSFGSVSDSTGMRAACVSMIKSGSHMWMYSRGVNSNPKFSIVAYLPGKSQPGDDWVYCIGSNGGSSISSWANPPTSSGCAADPNGNGQ